MYVYFCLGEFGNLLAFLACTQIYSNRALFRHVLWTPTRGRAWFFSVFEASL